MAGYYVIEYDVVKNNSVRDTRVRAYHCHATRVTDATRAGWRALFNALPVTPLRRAVVG